MEDYLKTLCITLGINLIYNNNKTLALSADIKNGIPTIRAHKIFKGCGLKVAKSVLGYYTDLEKKNTHLEIIEDYLKENFVGENFMIKASKALFKEAAVENMPLKNKLEKDDSSLTEYDISQITVKSFGGDEKEVDPNSSLNASAHDLLELSIIVKPPVT